MASRWTARTAVISVIAVLVMLLAILASREGSAVQHVHSAADPEDSLKAALANTINAQTYQVVE